MTGRRTPVRSRRSAREWIVRSVLAAGIAAVAYLGITDSLAHATEGADPADAHRLAPWNGVITAELAEDTFLRTPKASEESEAARLARLALRQDATAAAALYVLGQQAQLRNETRRANNLFRYSWLLSRRELKVQLWSIEEAASRGDVDDALRSYDVALRTSLRARTLLFPVLASALTEPAIRAGLLPIIETRPMWTNAFVDYIATTEAEPAAAAAFFREAEGHGLLVDENDRAALVNTLAATEGSEAAWRYYQSFRSGVTALRSRDPEFTLQVSTRTLFDWRTSEDAQLSAAIFGSEEGGMLDFAVPPTIGGVLLSQSQLLPPGTYLMEGRSSRIQQPERSQPYWTLKCRDGRELGRVTVPDSTQSKGRFQGEFQVPVDCPEQTLQLVARATDAIAGVAGQIDRAALISAQGSDADSLE